MKLSNTLLRRKSCRKLGGFTLVELLVVIAIIGLLISILLPAIQASREAARRMSCTNNLHQLGIAVLTYEEAKKTYPPAGIVSRSGNAIDLRSGPMFSWIVTILPYMDQGPLYKQFDLKRNVFDQPGDPQSLSIEPLMCPSDSAQGRFFSDASLTHGKRCAKGNYAAFTSPYHVDLQLIFPGALIATGQERRKVRDGISRTMMLTEVRTRSQEQDQRGAWALPWTGSSLLAFDMHHDDTIPYVDRFVASPLSAGQTQLPNNRGPNVDMLYACPDIQDAQIHNMPCLLWQAGSMYDFLSAAPRSLHKGGVNTAFMDGHLGFLRNNIDEKVMAYLISVNDGQTVSLDDGR
jgi:prepilin-type N-terminal cleavage/methylation domain-containing protein/prepilin-type processing-associated H-X9-DG protein